MQRKLGSPALILAIVTVQLACRCPAQCDVQWVPDVGAIGVAGATMFQESSPSVRALTVFDDGTGPALYAGGAFTSIGGVVANCIAKWDGVSWSPLGSGVAGGTFYGSPASIADTFVGALQVFDDGSGPKLYVGGSFATAGGISAANLARWTGTTWESIGGCSDDVLAFETADLGFASLLFVGGRFYIAGGNVFVGKIGTWNGSFWSALTGGPTPGVTSGSGFVDAIEFFDDGSGPAVYVGGLLNTVNNVPLGLIGRFDITGWHTLGAGLGGGFEPHVRKIKTLDLGDGPALYVGGQFGSSIFGPSLANLAKWKNGQWSNPTPGLPWPPTVYDLTAIDQGTGPKLAVAGSYIETNSAFVHGVGVWEGSAWSALIPSGLLAANSTGLGKGLVFHEFDDGRGPSLFLGGGFDYTGQTALPAHGIARLGPSTPLLGIRQPGPGLGGFVRNGGLLQGHEYFNLFSVESCSGALGSGPYFGLCATDLSFLIAQAFSPVGYHPFHFVATAASMEFGPYAVPPGTHLEGVTVDVTYGTPDCTSPVIGYSVQ